MNKSMKNIIALCGILCSACTFDIVTPPSDTKTPDASVDVQDAGNPNADLLQLVDLTTLVNNCKRFDNDAGNKYLTYQIPYDSSKGNSALAVYMCSEYMNPSCDVEKLFMNEPSYYTNLHPWAYTANIEAVPNALGKDCNLINIKDMKAVYSSSSGTTTISDVLLDNNDPLNYIEQCASAGGDVYTTLIEFYDSEFNAFMMKNVSGYSFICN